MRPVWAHESQRVEALLQEGQGTVLGKNPYSLVRYCWTADSRYPKG